jgi:transcriptional regulator with XRE-family HTH domain
MPSNPTSLNHIVGRRIAAARRSARLTQAQLAAKLDWPRDTLIHYENGRRAIAVDRIEQIAAALGIPAATLLIDDEALAAIFTQLASDPYLPKQVRFFLATLEDNQQDQA